MPIFTAKITFSESLIVNSILKQRNLYNTEIPLTEANEILNYADKYENKGGSYKTGFTLIIANDNDSEVIGGYEGTLMLASIDDVYGANIINEHVTAALISRLAPDAPRFWAITGEKEQALSRKMITLLDQATVGA